MRYRNFFFQCIVYASYRFIEIYSRVGYASNFKTKINCLVGDVNQVFMSFHRTQIWKGLFCIFSYIFCSFSLLRSTNAKWFMACFIFCVVTDEMKEAISLLCKLWETKHFQNREISNVFLWCSNNNYDIELRNSETAGGTLLIVGWSGSIYLL